MVTTSDAGNDEQKALTDLERAERDLERGELKSAEAETRKAEREIEEARKDHEVTIVVDGVQHQLHRRRWIVSELKQKLGIDPAKVLAKITPHGLKDLDDNEEIELHNGEQFMTHARSGGSS